MLLYLAEKEVTHTRQIDLNTIEDYQTWRKAAKSTRKLELTYIGNLILDNKDIYTVAKLAGHKIAACEKHYTRIGMSKKAKSITDMNYGSTRPRNIKTESY